MILTDVRTFFHVFQKFILDNNIFCFYDSDGKDTINKNDIMLRYSDQINTKPISDSDDNKHIIDFFFESASRLNQTSVNELISLKNFAGTTFDPTSNQDIKSNRLQKSGDKIKTDFIKTNWLVRVMCAKEQNINFPFSSLDILNGFRNGLDNAYQDPFTNYVVDGNEIGKDILFSRPAFYGNYDITNIDNLDENNTIRQMATINMTIAIFTKQKLKTETYFVDEYQFKTQTIN